MADTNLQASTDLQQISARNENARRIVAGCMSAMPTLAAMWRHLDAALNDAVALAAQLASVSADLDRSRLDRANLIAAMRAALAAHADGEPDPLWYLRDELDAPETASAATRRRA